jgi:plastocyanin
MKNIKYFLVLLVLQLWFYQANSTTWTVTAGGSSFTPTPLTVTVGDTVKWQWLNGVHTTTSTIIPAGALPWTAPLDTLNPTFRYKITTPGTYNYQCNFHVTFGMVGVINANPIGIKPIGTSVPSSYNIEQNYPNPFNPSTNIRFDIPKNANVKIVIFDMIGNEVQTLVNGELQAGSYTTDWNASGFPSGIYFYRMQSELYSVTKKMILIK